MHGYEMIREIEDQSGEIFRLNLGTLYPMLHALESEDPRTASVPGTEADGGSRRPGGAADAANHPRLEWDPLFLAGSLLGVGLFTLHTVESHGSATGGSSRSSRPGDRTGLILSPFIPAALRGRFIDHPMAQRGQSLAVGCHTYSPTSRGVLSSTSCRASCIVARRNSPTWYPCRSSAARCPVG